MTAKEFGTFAAALRTYYSRENILPNSQAMELWYRQLQDIPYPVAEAVLQKWVATNRWSPSIADIRESAAEIQTGGPIEDWATGWNQVLSAIRKFGTYQEQAALEWLPPLARETVQRLGYKQLCLSDNLVADRANFRQVYEILARRKAESERLPLPLRERISGLMAGFAALPEQAASADLEQTKQEVDYLECRTRPVEVTNSESK